MRDRLHHADEADACFAVMRERGQRSFKLTPAATGVGRNRIQANRLQRVARIAQHRSDQRLALRLPIGQKRRSSQFKSKLFTDGGARQAENRTGAIAIIQNENMRKNGFQRPGPDVVLIRNGTSPTQCSPIIQKYKTISVLHFPMHRRSPRRAKPNGSRHSSPFHHSPRHSFYMRRHHGHACPWHRGLRSLRHRGAFARRLCGRHCVRLKSLHPPETT